MRFCCVDTTGRILQIGTALEWATVGDLAHLPGTVIFYVPDEVTLATHYFADGVFLPFGDPPSVSHTWDWASFSWGLDLEMARADRSASIDEACQSAILSGFESSALGAPHHYPAKMTDQQNLLASVTASMYPGLPAEWTTPFWCADSSGMWQFRQHTAAQIQNVGVDAKAAILSAMAHNEQLQAQIAGAETVNQLEEITWSSI